MKYVVSLVHSISHEWSASCSVKHGLHNLATLLGFVVAGLQLQTHEIGPLVGKQSPAIGHERAVKDGSGQHMHEACDRMNKMPVQVSS